MSDWERKFCRNLTFAGGTFLSGLIVTLVAGAAGNVKLAIGGLVACIASVFILIFLPLLDVE